MTGVNSERTAAAAVTALIDFDKDDEWTEMDLITCLVVFFVFFSYQLQPVHICSVVIYNQTIYSLSVPLWSAKVLSLYHYNQSIVCSVPL